MLRIAEHWQGSDLGRQRQGNEDSYFVRAPLFVVADGMGGAQAGEVASEMAVESFERGLPGDGSPAEGLVAIVEAANRRIHERSRSDAEYAGMGTTTTAAHVGEGEVTIAHVGDSRAYVLRGGDLIRLTRDHSLVGELVARGKLTEEQAEAHPQRSVITRALGPEPSVQVDVETFPARSGDVFLLCSDGLTGMVNEAALKRVLQEADGLERAGRELIAAANDAGGRDNITVVLFRLEDVAVGPATGSNVAAAPGTSDEDTREYDTREGLRAEEVHAAVEASNETEAEYRRSGTMAMTPVRPRATPGEAPIDGGAPAGQPPNGVAQRRRRRLIPPVVIVVACMLAIVGAAFWAATRVVFFVGTDPVHSNAVAIYQGLPYELPFGLRLYSRYGSPSGVTLEQVPSARRATFTDHKLRSLDDAENLINALEEGKLQP
jgi:serine/threonine protein phosphatase PrpC